MLGKNIYQRDHTQKPEIFTLIMEHRNEEAIRHFARHPDEINLKGWMDHTPLHKAAECGNLEIAQFLIAKGARVNAERSGVYATPLCWAATVEIAMLLLDHGATMNDRELYLATRQDRVDVVDLLLTKGATIDSNSPQYLICRSTEAIDVYLKHGVSLKGSDEHNRGMLHEIAWTGNPELFDHAYQSGAPWAKDLSSRTPYTLARQGKRTEMIAHLQKKYPALTSHRVAPLSDAANLPFAQIHFFLEHPTENNVFFALVKDYRIRRYELRDGIFYCTHAREVDLPIIRNFTFSPGGKLVIPTADEKLLFLDPADLCPKGWVKLEGREYDQITYLPGRKLYFASAHWVGYFLDEEFKVVREQDMEDGVFYPLVNKGETMLSIASYDQDTYYDLYRIQDDLELPLIKCFFIEWGNVSHSFAFSPDGDHYAVTYPRQLFFGKVSDMDAETIWSAEISETPSEHDWSAVVFNGPNKIILGKGRKLISYEAESGKEIDRLNLNLKGEIKKLYFNREGTHLIVLTRQEILAIRITGLLK